MVFATGTPISNTMVELYTIGLYFKVSPAEMALIEEKMEQAGTLNKRAYLRKIAVDGYIVHVDMGSVKELVRLLGTISRNVNQIAKRCNETRNLYGEDVEDLKKGYAQVQSMIAYAVEKFGRVDILVNSAGSRGAHGTLEEEFSTENFQETMNADFASTFMAVKYAYPECAKSGVGSIINVASLAALRASGPVVYSAAKGAVKSFSKVMAKKLGPDKVRVNTIYPGFIVTEMTEKIHEMPEEEARMKKDSPLGMLGEIQDIAYCALYLASDASRFVTGQDFIIDGGAMCG